MNTAEPIHLMPSIQYYDEYCDTLVPDSLARPPYTNLTYPTPNPLLMQNIQEVTSKIQLLSIDRLGFFTLCQYIIVIAGVGVHVFDPLGHGL